MLSIPNRSHCVLHLAAVLFQLVASAGAARADIFQWEYIDPADLSQGKRQSTTLAPNGAGVDAVPGANLSNRDLTMAYLIGADLTGAAGFQSDLTNADLSQANLANAVLLTATLTDADFTGAEIRGANFFPRSLFPIFHNGTGITLAQLYSTTSYQAGDLREIGLGYHNLAGGKFVRQNLTNASFYSATLTDSDFQQSNLTNAYFSGDNLIGANFREASLANASFYGATLTGADFATADARGAQFDNLSGATTTNLILPDGHISGLVLDAGALLIVRDYDGNPATFPEPTGPVAITIDQHLTMNSSGMLRMVFEADAWDSTISFASGIPVALGGTLELTLANDVNLASQVGRTFDIFDWTGVNPTGAFAVSSPYAWDLSNLYTTGQVTLTAVPEPCTSTLCVIALTLILRRRAYRRLDRL